MTNLSQWFDLEEQKTWEVGVYQFQAIDKLGELIGTYYSWWDGNDFNGGWGSVDDAKSIKSWDGFKTYIISKWRGLSANPEVKKKPSWNKKVTKYVVMSHYHQDTHSQAVAVFSSLKSAQSRAEEVKKTVGSEYEVWVSLTRFCTPE